MTNIRMDPITRIEGHLDIDVSVETVDGVQQVIDARSSATMFRGFEIMLKDRDPRDATIFTQRICGVCPISHAMASTLNLEFAFSVVPPTNGRILRNLVLGANFIMSHILHFYHLAALDYIDTEGVVDMSPWIPRYVTGDMVEGPVAGDLVGHYVQALEIRRKAHQMGAIFGAKLPCTSTFVPGGCTEVVTSDKVDDFSTLLGDIRGFIDGVYIPDVLTVADAFSDYFSIGVGCGNLLAYGVFDLNNTQTSKLLPRGRYTDGDMEDVDPDEITECVKFSRYAAENGDLNPSVGITEPDIDKPEAYSWIKSPRYNGKVHEVGPLARIYVSYLAEEPTVKKLVDYVLTHFDAQPDALFSVLGRHAARALECKFVADSMDGLDGLDGWLRELEPGEPVYEYSSIPEYATGMGLTEAPRGALGHWIEINYSKISRYQVITPTAWNASPRDHDWNEDPAHPDYYAHMGPIEQALIGTPVNDIEKPIELLRVVHSFDPCIACAVHLITPEGKSLGKFRVN